MVCRSSLDGIYLLGTVKKIELYGAKLIILSIFFILFIITIAQNKERDFKYIRVAFCILNYFKFC